MTTMSDYEVLPQRAPRAPRAKRKFRTDDEEVKAPQTSTQAVDETKVTKKIEESVTQQQRGVAADLQTGGIEEVERPAPYRSTAEPNQKFEYLDHTADVQLHAWGKTLREAFENVGLCMMNYMTPLTGIEAHGKTSQTRTYKASGLDLHSLLYHWLDELLFGFATDCFVPCELQIVTFDRESWMIEARGSGEVFDHYKHASGTEIKAITYSAMQVEERDGDAEVFVIVDI